jgi:hypothetical protein
VADGVGSDTVPTVDAPSYPRSAVWSFHAARLLLALRQSDYTFIVVREEMVERVLKWVRCPSLPQRSYGTGLLLCTCTPPPPTTRRQPHCFTAKFVGALSLVHRQRCL